MDVFFRGCLDRGIERKARNFSTVTTVVSRRIHRGQKTDPEEENLAEEGTLPGSRRSRDVTISTTSSERMRTTEADLKPLGYRDEGGGKEGEVDGGQPSPPPRRLSYEQESERGEVG